MAWDRSTNEQWVIELRRRMGADVCTGVISGSAGISVTAKKEPRIDLEKRDVAANRFTLPGVR